EARQGASEHAERPAEGRRGHHRRRRGEQDQQGGRRLRHRRGGDAGRQADRDALPEGLRPDPPSQGHRQGDLAAGSVRQAPGLADPEARPSHGRTKAVRVNRYPVWRYAIIVIALLFGTIYTLPNFFGESPAVQVSSLKATVKVDEQTERAVLEALQSANLAHTGVLRDANSVKVRFATPDTQLRARD